MTKKNTNSKKINDIENNKDKEIEEENVDDLEELEIDEDDTDEFVSNPLKKTMSDKTRYILIAVLACLVLGLIVVLAIFGDSSATSLSSKSNSTSSNSSTNSTSSNETKERNTSTDTLKEFYKEFDSRDLNIIFFARTSCGFCSLEKPILNQIKKDYDIDYYAIDTDKLSTTEVSEIMSTLGITGSTPTTVIVKDGKVVATQVGYLDGQPYVDFFASNGILKKDSIYKPEANLKRVNYSEFKSIVKEKDYNLLFLDTSGCSACIEVRSMLSDMAKKYKITINYLSEISQTDANSLINNELKEWGYSEKSYKENSQIIVPLLLVTKNNKIVDYLLESTDESDYTKILKKYNFID